MTVEQDLISYRQDLLKGQEALERLSKARLVGKIAQRLKLAFVDCISSVEEILEIPVKNGIDEPTR